MTIEAEILSSVFSSNRYTYDNDMERSVVDHFTDMQKAFDHFFCIINGLQTKITLRIITEILDVIQILVLRFRLN